MTMYVPVIPFEGRASDVATPLALVVWVSELVPLGKVPLAPPGEACAVNVTVVPTTGVPVVSGVVLLVTMALNPDAYAVLKTWVCEKGAIDDTVVTCARVGCALVELHPVANATARRVAASTPQ